MKQNSFPVRGSSTGLMLVITLITVAVLFTLGGHGETAAAGALWPGSGPRVTSAIGRAIWANGTCTPTTLDLTGSYQYIVGGLHSNGTIKISGNVAYPTYISGPVEHVGEISYMEDLSLIHI